MSATRWKVRAAIGDPQAPFETFLAILDLHGLLGDDARLRPDVFLVSMGDHFDYGPSRGPANPSRDGARRGARADGITWESRA